MEREVLHLDIKLQIDLGKVTGQKLPEHTSFPEVFVTISGSVSLTGMSYDNKF